MAQQQYSLRDWGNDWGSSVLDGIQKAYNGLEEAVDDSFKVPPSDLDDRVTDLVESAFADRATITPEEINLDIAAKAARANSFGQYYANTSVLVPAHTTEAAEWKLDLVRSAEHSIEWSGNYFGGRIFREALEVMEEKMQRNSDFQVHLISSPELLESEDYRRLEELSARYPSQFHVVVTHTQIAPSLPDLTKTWSQENHIKVLIVDRKYTVFGGASYQDYLASYEGKQQKIAPEESDPKAIVYSWMYNGASDTDVVCIGKEHAEGLGVMFFKLFEFWEKQEGVPHAENRYFALNEDQIACSLRKLDENPELIPNVSMKMTFGSPSISGQNPCMLEHARVIREAKQSLKISNLLFNPPQIIMQALIEALESGVKIDLLTNGEAKEGPAANSLIAWGNRPRYIELFEKDPTGQLVQIFEYIRPYIINHSKILAADGERAIVSSYNLGIKSERDFELMATFDSPLVARKIEQIIQRDCTHADAVDRSEAHAWAHRWDYQLIEAIAALLTLPYTG